MAKSGIDAIHVSHAVENLVCQHSGRREMDGPEVVSNAADLAERSTRVSTGLVDNLEPRLL